MCAEAPSWSLDPTRLLSQYMRQQWKSDKGYLGGSVSAIAQTSDGYLWIGTEKGLVRFDGLNFRLFPQATPTSFPIGPVQSLTADAQGNLWIVLQNTKILRYHDGKFELGREIAENGITCSARRADGTPLFASLALGTLTYRAGRFDKLVPSGNVDTSGAPDTPENLSSRNSWATGVVPHRFAEPNSAVLAMAETSDGKLWLGTVDKGLFYSSNGRTVSAGQTLRDIRISSLLPLSKSELWIGTENGVWRWNGSEVTQVGVPASLQRGAVLAMIRDADANIWIGLRDGLVRVKSDLVTVDAERSRSAGSVTALFEDREHNVWVGGADGIERIRDGAFVTYSLPALQTESSGPVFVDQDHRVWFAPVEGGLHWFNGTQSVAVLNENLSRDVVYSIAGGKNDLWIGRQQNGLTHLRYESGSMHGETYTQADGLAQNSVYAVYLAHDGAVWAGTLSGGVSEFRNKRFLTYTTADGLPSNAIAAIAETADATMWFATPNGLASFNRGDWRIFGVREGLPSENVNSLLADTTGILWIGTASGVAYLSPGHQLQIPTKVPASLQEPIMGIAQDNGGWLWISTSNHVLRVRRNKLLADSLSDADVREYGLEDGLRGVEGVKRQQSVFADPGGKIWFSTNHGLSVVDPARATVNSAPATALIEGLSVDGIPLSSQQAINLTGTHRRLTIQYQALSLSVPDRVRFKYKLDGVDDGWSNPVSAREVTYHNLDSGPYRFRVVASNSDGLWNSAESDLAFQINPSYWQTWWFRLSIVFALAAVVLLLIRLRMRRLAGQMNIRFEERLAERTRIAQELHDTLLQGFVSASMQLHVADDRLPVDSPAKPAIGRVLQLMSSVIDEGRNAVRGLRSSDVLRQSLEESFSGIHKELTASAHAGFSVIVEGEPRPLRVPVRDDVYFIGREALVNAFRHAKATEIEVEIEYAANRLRLLVRDNGCGIDPQVLNTGRDGHWGLSGMRERADRIGARLRVLSRAAAGTEIELAVPGRLAFEPRPADRSAHWFSRLYSRKSGEAKSHGKAAKADP